MKNLLNENDIWWISVNKHFYLYKNAKNIYTWRNVKYENVIGHLLKEMNNVSSTYNCSIKEINDTYSKQFEDYELYFGQYITEIEIKNDTRQDQLDSIKKLNDIMYKYDP